MKNINMIAIECMRELDVIGIKYGNVIKFEVNTRAKKRWGQCRKVGDNYIININQILLRDDTDIEGLKNTMIHELLHTCKGCMKHTGEWKRLAEKVNRYYGYNIKRCSDAEEKGVSKEQQQIRKEERIQRQPKHKFRCINCGQEIIRYKESNFTKNPNRYRCAACGSRFEKVF